MSALRGSSLVETLVALVVTSMIFVFVVGLIEQVDQGHETLNRLDKDQVNSNETLIAFLRANLEMIALVPQARDPRRVEFSISQKRLSFVSRLIPPAAQTGLHKITVDLVSENTIDIAVERWPRGAKIERLSQQVSEIAFASVDRRSAGVGLPRAVLVMIGEQRYYLKLGSTLPSDCIAKLPISKSSLTCPEIDE